MVVSADRLQNRTGRSKQGVALYCKTLRPELKLMTYIHPLLSAQYLFPRQAPRVWSAGTYSHTHLTFHLPPPFVWGQFAIRFPSKGTGKNPGRILYMNIEWGLRSVLHWEQGVQRKLYIGCGTPMRPRFCVTISRTPLWYVSRDAKHHISGILSRIRKGSLSITKIWLLVFCYYFCYETENMSNVHCCRPSLTGLTLGFTSTLKS